MAYPTANAKRCALPSINQPCRFRLHSFEKGWKSSKLPRNGCSLRLTYSSWIARPELHATNYLRRNPSTNFLTFCYCHCFLSPAFPWFSFMLVHYFQKYQSAKGFPEYTNMQIGQHFLTEWKSLLCVLSPLSIVLLEKIHMSYHVNFI